MMQTHVAGVANVCLAGGLLLTARPLKQPGPCLQPRPCTQPGPLLTALDPQTAWPLLTARPVRQPGPSNILAPHTAWPLKQLGPSNRLARRRRNIQMKTKAFIKKEKGLELGVLFSNVV